MYAFSSVLVPLAIVAAWYGSRISLADLRDLGVAGESGAFVEPS
jgi:hypothetical protein